MTSNAKKVLALKESSKYQKIKDDLLNQMQCNCTVGEYYDDLIEDYMTMWVTKCMLSEDIEKRGVTVKYNNGGGQKGVKKNESIAEYVKLNAQMLKLLSEVGIKPSSGESDDDEL